MFSRTAAGLALAVSVALAGCGAPGPRPDPAASPVVATIDGAPIPESAFEDYLAVHLVQDGLEEPLPQGDDDRVRSRLFDDFVAESLLVFEADRRGVTIDDAEIRAWLGEEPDPEPAREKARRRQAARELAGQRLLDAWIRAEAKAHGESPAQDVPAEMASERLVAALRAKYKIELHPEVLPFRYVPEDPPGSPPR